MPPPSEYAARTWQSPSKVNLIPAEILSQIFLLVVEDPEDGDRMQLMLVCWRWYDIVLSTPGMPSGVSIQKSTTLEMVRAAVQGTRWSLHVTIGEDHKSIGQDFNADAFDACFMAAIEAASRWKSLFIYSLPLSGNCGAFRIAPRLINLEYFCLLKPCDLGSFFEPLMTAITTATQHLTKMNVQDSNAVLYLVQPDRFHVFRYLTTLTIWLSKRMESPADILPHLQRLESFSARHLYLPIYPPDTRLSLVYTLRDLHLISVSIQWMAGKVFHVLWKCAITFPRDSDTIYMQPVTMSACTSLYYNSNDLGPIRYFLDLPLAKLGISNGQWNIRRGNLQLIAICQMIVPCAQSVTNLSLGVRCSEKLLTIMLRLLPALRALFLRLASPSALSETFFQAFVATKSNVFEMGARPSLPLCSKLEHLEVIYKRWLRGVERTALLLVFGDIVSSRRSVDYFQLRLNFEGLSQGWFVWSQVERIHEIADYELFVIGISIPQGIIPLVSSGLDPLKEVPIKEAEYLLARDQLSIGCLLTLHHLVELRVEGETNILPSKPPPNLPLFRTLRILEAGNIYPSFLAGQTFHKLERCRISLYGEGPKLSQTQVTQMPVCTRLDVEDLTLLATLKLPQICELGASFAHPEFNMIWEKRLAVNVNLSGLELLHVSRWYQQTDLVQVLKCLPVLTSLVLGNGSDLDANFFGEFLPMHLNETSVLMHPHDEGHLSAVLCPLLSSLLVEGYDPIEQLELIPLFKEIVALRAVGGSPLKKFTLFNLEIGSKYELIGSYGTFVVKREFLDETAESFRLDI